MGRAPCCDKANVNKGPWSPEEDSKLREYIEKHGTGGSWIALPQKAGLKRCGKSCRLRWLNYLRPNIKHGEFSDDEDRIICSLYASIGSRWSIIAAQLPGRTDNNIKNYWNTKLKKKLIGLVSASHMIPPFQSFHGNPPFHSSQSLSSSIYRDCSSYYSPALTTISLANYFPCFQNHESLFSASPIQDYGIGDNLIVFGSEGSCSSSDGSCSQVSHSHEEMGIQKYMSSGFEEYSNKFMLSYGSNNINQWAEEPNGCFGQTTLDYDLEGIKQLINSSSGNNDYNGYFNMDERKEDIGEGRVLLLNATDD